MPITATFVPVRATSEILRARGGISWTTDAKGRLLSGTPVRVNVARKAASPSPDSTAPAEIERVREATCDEHVAIFVERVRGCAEAGVLRSERACPLGSARDVEKGDIPEVAVRGVPKRPNATQTKIELTVEEARHRDIARWAGRDLVHFLAVRVAKTTRENDRASGVELDEEDIGLLGVTLGNQRLGADG